MSALRQVCHSPRIFVADEFVSAEEAAHVLTLGASPDAVEARGIATKHDETGFSFEMPIDGDPVLESIRDRIQRAFGMVNLHGATFRFRRYLTSEAHPPHLDTYEIQGSHLVLTALIHLVDCAGGGATRFPRATPKPMAIEPARGRLVGWFNYYPNGAPDQSSFHDGAPITAGEKVTITAFMYRPLADAGVRPPAFAKASADKRAL